MITSNTHGHSLKIQGGQTGTFTISANTSINRTITFNNAFATIPKIQASLCIGGTEAAAKGRVFHSVYGASTTGFSVRIYSRSTTAYGSSYISWVAIGE